MITIDSSKKVGSNETWSGKAIGVVAFAATAYISYYFYKKKQKAKTNNQEQVLNTQGNNAVKINNAKTVNDIELQNNEADCTIRKRLHDDVLHISKKPLRGELSGFLSIYQAEASCISPKVY